MSADGPWIRFFASDWLAGTAKLSAVERGVYITLIAQMYEEGAPIRRNETRLARLCALPTPSFLRALEALIEMGKIIVVDEGKLWQRRVEIETENRVARASKARDAAKAKHQQNQSTISASAPPKHSSEPASRARLPEPEPEPEVLEPLPSPPNDRSVIVENPVGAVSPKRAPAERGTALPVDWVLPRGWGEWAQREFPHLARDEIIAIAAEFKDYWIGVPGQRGRKRDWEATWRNRVRASASRTRGSNQRRKRGLDTVIDDFTKELTNDGYGNPTEESGHLGDDARLPLISGPH